MVNERFQIDGLDLPDRLDSTLTLREGVVPRGYDVGVVTSVPPGLTVVGVVEMARLGVDQWRTEGGNPDIATSEKKGPKVYEARDGVPVSKDPAGVDRREGMVGLYAEAVITSLRGNADFLKQWVAVGFGQDPSMNVRRRVLRAEMPRDLSARQRASYEQANQWHKDFEAALIARIRERLKAECTVTGTRTKYEGSGQFTDPVAITSDNFWEMVNISKIDCFAPVGDSWGLSVNCVRGLAVESIEWSASES